MVDALEPATLPKAPKLPMLPTIRKLFKPSQLSPPMTPPPAYTASAQQSQLLPATPKELQIIENRYIDHDKLLEFCKERFGLGNYQLRYKSKKYYLHVPTLLDEDTLEQFNIFNV
ncbi:hypothetical protein P280DRAFT_473566 [Massarina eburnea CBS 473.64]|uniref:Uncharacterized protein n=1 Tax=Massarina eburnea CBS 473.64 TaxID=1395130 RepID=A0A6A6RKV5_9PLEO|nr:hypothetical protein P280DRAFT_473566 [Massarina eburnea CBS 473.64]